MTTKVLAYHIAKQHRLFERIALDTNRSVEAVRKQLNRGNPLFEWRIQITNSICNALNQDIDTQLLWKRVKKQSYHTLY